jgi:titin
MRGSTPHTSGSLGRRRLEAFAHLFIATAITWLVLLPATPVRAQSILDGQRVQFPPSTDDATLAPDGTPVLQNYNLTVYLAGTSTAFATANLGHPAADSTGMITVAFSPFLSTPLQAGVIYEATVSAVGPGGSTESGRTNTFELTTTCASTVPTTTQNVAASASTGSIGVTATCAWVALSNAPWLSITSGASGTGNGTVGYSVAANTLTTARSAALTIAGNTVTFNQAAAAATTVPGAPTAVTGTAGNTQVSLTWTAPSSNGGAAITGYQVQVGTSASGPFSNAAGCSTTSTTAACTATGLTNGTTYFFQVAAINSVGTGSFSAASSGVTPAGLPGAPTAVSGTAGNTQVALTWTAPSSTGGSAITGYQVQVGTSATGPFSNATGCTTTSTTTACTATGLTNGTTYFFQAAAINAVGTGSFSAVSSGVTPAGVPGAPTAISGTAGNTQVSLTWTAPSSNGGSAITGYQVQVATSATGTYSNATGCSTTSTTTACTATGLTNGTTYFFKVAAINANGAGSYSSASGGVTPVGVPSAPTAVSGTAGNTQVSLTWTAPSSNGGSAITGYQVQVATSASGPFSNAAGCSTTSTTAACTATSLTNGTTYFFQVAAINSVGTGSVSAVSSGVTPVGVPGVPTAVSGAAGNTQVSLTWTAPSSNGGSAITGYQVQVATSASGPFSAAAGCPTTSTTTACTATGLANGATYFFQVAATNGVGTGSFSAVSSGITPVGVPGAPTAVAGVAGNTQVSLTWTAPASNGGSAITGYQVQVATSATGTYGNAAGCPTTSTTTACTATGLTNGTPYFFKVAAINANGAGTYSGASAGVTPVGVPGAPTGVAGTAGNTQVSVTWTAPGSNGGSAITGYQVQVATSAGGPFSNAAGCSTTSTATACTATGLTNGTSYFFQVAAINAIGTGSYSAVSSGVTPIAVPGAPTGVTGTAGNTQVSLTWTAPGTTGGSAITGYQVQVATSATGPFSNAAGCSATSTTTACTATGLTNGTTYFFQVAAINAIGTGTYSAVSSGVTPTGVPGAPTAVAGTAGNGQVALTWTAPSSNGGSAITGYQVQVATSATGTYSNAAGCSTTSTTASCTATGLTNGTTYFFKVAAINAVGTGSYSAASSGVTPAGVPGAPTAVAGTAGNTQVSLTWTAPSSTGGSAITGYQVQVATSASGPFSNAAGCSTTSTTAACTATGLTNGTTYFFQVAAINAIGTGSYSTVSSGVTPTGVPGAPTAVSGTAGNGQVALTWTAPSSNGGSAITGYQVQVATSATGSYGNAAGCSTTSTTTACTATGLTNGTTYFFKVAAINAIGGGSYSTASSGVTPVGVPPAPTGVTGTAGNTQVALTWTAPSSNGGSAITGYQVQVATSASGTYSNAAGCATTSTTTACTATGLANGTTYFFQVAAINATGTGSYSAASNGVTPAGLPGTPTAVAGTAGSAQVSLTWTAPASNGGSAITGYQVQIATSATGAYSNAAGCSTTSTTTACTATGLTNGTTYFFKVAAMNAIGTGSSSAASSGVTPVGVPGAPTALSGKSGISQVALTWTAPTSNGGNVVTGYQVQVGTSASGPFSNAAGCPTTSVVAACTATGLTNGTTYFFQVAAINANGTGSYSSVSSGVTPAGVPGAPTGVTGAAANTLVSLTWTAPASNGGSAIIGYQVQLATSATGTYSNAAGCSTVSTATACTATGLTNNTTYFFKVAAINAIGTGSYSAASSGVTPIAVPGSPTNVAGTPGNGQVALTWIAPNAGGSPITGYQVQIATNASGPFTSAAGCSTSSTAASCTATGLTNGTTYFFQVAAINAIGTSPYSAVSNGVTPISTPGAPSGVAGTRGDQQVALTWTAPTNNGGSAITGYKVQFATSASGTYINAVSCPTTSTVAACTVTGLLDGTTYFFEVAAVNAAGTGSYSAPSSGVTPVATQTTQPTLTLDRTTLNYGATTGTGGFSSQTPAQIVHLTQSGSGNAKWTASSNSPWLTVSPTSGNGSATLTVSVTPSGLSSMTAADMSSLGSVGGSINVTATGTSNNPGSVVVTLLLFGQGMSSAPFGSFDTPTDGTTGVSGSIAVSGWALDDEAVSAVRILRAPVAGEAPGQLVAIGNATLIDGARPDVAAANASRPLPTRGGWGYLILTNMLPNQGNGTFTLYAYADDVDGHSTLLGTKTIACDNADAPAPFGAIDVPIQGATVSGVVANFGWVLSQGNGRADPPGGGTVTVFIDGVAAGSPGGWTSRSDLSTLFPSSQYSGVSTALGVFSFDSTTLADGIHTLAWIVTDAKGGTAGVGSRFFSVFNGANAVVAASAAAPVAARVSAVAASAAGTLPSDTGRLLVRRGGAADAPLQTVAAGANGGFSLTVEELEPVTFTLDDPASGDFSAYLRGTDGLAPLPLGSQFDATSRQFTWHPGPGFVGQYALAFVRSSAGKPVAQVDVTITLLPKGTRLTPHVVIDTPQNAGTVQGEFLVAGWAFDGRAATGTGIDTLEVWAYADDGTSPVYLGQATAGVSRSDVAAVYGSRAGSSGYQLTVRSLAPGGYTLAVFGHSTVTGTFLPAATVHIAVR